MQRNSMFVVLVWCLLVLYASGCGSSNQAGDTQSQANKKNGGAGSVNPSALITKEEAEVALGEPVSEPKFQHGSMGQKIALYEAVDVTSTRFIQISVVEGQEMPAALKAQGYNAKKLYEDTRAGLDNKPVTGIGSDAFWGIPGLHILKGDLYLVISVGNTDLPENLELAKSLAEKALNRI